jgi:Ca2+-binding EF-hand superfamily protein
MLYQWFTKVDGGKGRLAPAGLQTALKMSKLDFSLEVCLLLVKMFDSDKSGTIEFKEFMALYDYIIKMMTHFKQR